MNDLNIFSYFNIYMTSTRRIFMMLFNPTGYNKIIPADNYINEKVDDYIQQQQKGEINYKIQTKDTVNEFSIDHYDAVAEGLKGDYSDFYLYKNTTNNEKNIISPNEEKLKAFCAYINRLTHF